MATILFSHKRGDTFDYAGTLTLPAGTWTPTAQVRQGDTLIADLTATLEDPSGGETAVRVVATDTTAWPLGTMRFDIQFDGVGGQVISTDTVAFKVVADITRDES